MHPSKLDLFGEVVITLDDLRAWLVAVPRIDPDGPRALHYVRSYAVPDKVRQAKLSGTFDALTAPRDTPAAHWWARFHWS